MIGGWEEYVNFLRVDENDQCMEYSMVRKTDDEAKEILQEMGLTSGTVVQSLSKKERDSAIEKMLQEGLSIRQIERLTGISRGIIQKVKR